MSTVPALICSHCAAPLQQTRAGLSWRWHCVNRACPSGVMNWAGDHGKTRDVAILTFRRLQRVFRLTHHLDDDAARFLCRSAAEAWPQVVLTPGSIPTRLATGIEAALAAIDPGDDDIANANNWIALVTVGDDRSREQPVVDVLNRCANFGLALPCPLTPELGRCRSDCPGCYGDQELFAECSHCTPYITIISDDLVDAILYPPRTGRDIAADLSV